MCLVCVRVSVCHRSLYWEASRSARCLVVTPETLETLVAMKVNTLMPNVQRLVFRQAPPLGARGLPQGEQSIRKVSK